MIIRNAKTVMSSCVLLRDIKIENGIITDIQKGILPEKNEQVINASGLTLLPGFIDSHTHGAVGCVYSDGVSDIDKICEYEASEGVTTVAPTTLSLKPDEFEAVAAHLVKYYEKGTKGAKLAGIHAEGPFLNVGKKGAMNADNIAAPSIEAFDRMYDACKGNLKLMTVAPEMPGAIELIKHAVNNGVTVSAGHTDATYDEMLAAIDAGVTRMTHTFNACRALSHREPGILGAALFDSRVSCEVICDFIHLHPTAVELIYKLKGSSNFTAISDSEFCAGLAEGRMVSAGFVRIIEDGVAKLEDGTIAGAASSLYRAFKNLMSLGIPVWEVSEMLSANPAKALGISEVTGSIAIGKAADLILIDRELNIKNVLIGGNLYV